mmetsp:Transcript_17847/g.37065  ORF Transcript_17847/g.37065 Transcript_17847/m.37065 type:complete len:275 (+) Transcript_17847:2682-3506(+)
MIGFLCGHSPFSNGIGVKCIVQSRGCLRQNKHDKSQTTSRQKCIFASGEIAIEVEGKFPRGLISSLEAGTLNEIVQGSVLEKKAFQLVFSARRSGFQCEAFHAGVNRGGQPSLLLFRTEDGVIGGCRNPLGWDSRDDYRDSFNIVLFSVDERGDVRDGVKAQANHGQRVRIARKIGGPEAALFDFANCAVRVGPDALVIPMNESIDVPLNVATSRLGTHYEALDNGSRDLFGGGGRALLTDLDVYIAEQEEGSRQTATSTSTPPRQAPFRWFGQ